MLVASPGVGGEYDPHKPIDSKGADFFDDEEAEAIEPQGYNPVWDY
jgi:chaperone clpB